VIDLQMMFLKAIGEEEHQAIQELFHIRNAKQWAALYHVNAKWLIDFANQILRENWQLLCGDRIYSDQSQKAWHEALMRRRLIVERLDSAAAEVGTAWDDRTLDKREPQAHCRWLVMWLFGKMNDEQIAERAKLKEKTGSFTVGKRRRAIAKLLEIDLPERRGRPPKIRPDT
jgi:hypothetical protein